MFVACGLWWQVVIIASITHNNSIQSTLFVRFLVTLPTQCSDLRRRFKYGYSDTTLYYFNIHYNYRVVIHNSKYVL